VEALGVTAPAHTSVKHVETEAASSGQATTPLQTIELSPQVRIITDPQKAPSPESLAAFAKSMGLDESTIQNLLGEAASGTPSLTTTLTPAQSPTSATANPLLLQTPLGAATNNGGNADMQGLMTMQLPIAEQAPQPMTATSAGLANASSALSTSTLNAPVLTGLSPADMASIQQLQITVLPAAVLPVQSSLNTQDVPSTIDMLSLLSASGVDEKEISTLLSQFSENADSNTNPDMGQSSNDSSNSAHNFGQTLTRNTQTAAAANASAAASTSANMSEVYDQLSDKMTTELAARMHKQLSDGEWKMKFGLRPSNLGGVEIQLEMKDGKLDAVFRADNPLTRDLLQNSSQRLRDALGNFGINAGQVQVGQGGSNAQHNSSGHSTKQGQVRDNSTSQVNGTESSSSATSARNKANASLLDLYA
jgi:flagellar hook-length control protein FliK